jgi:hypothetical protein
MEMIIDKLKPKYFGNKGLRCEKPPSSCMSYGTAEASFQLESSLNVMAHGDAREGK